jgi:hypothetical protein
MELFRIGRPGSRPAWMYSPTRNASSSRPNELCAKLHDRTPVVLVDKIYQKSPMGAAQPTAL